jgi:hypothetical protein
MGGQAARGTLAGRTAQKRGGVGKDDEAVSRAGGNCLWALAPCLS